jgi:ammonium transporter, Amt family
MAINGALAGLVAITAGTAYVSPLSAVIIGAIAGVLVVLAVAFFDMIKADDPVGAIAVHGVCGSFGTIAVGIFHQTDGLIATGSFHLLGVQAIGLLAVSVWAFGSTYGTFYALKKIVGIRVPVEEETEGLDMSEHGFSAYNDMGVGSSQSSSPFGLPEHGILKQLVKEGAEA